MSRYKICIVTEGLSLAGFWAAIQNIVLWLGAGMGAGVRAGRIGERQLGAGAGGRQRRAGRARSERHGAQGRAGERCNTAAWATIRPRASATIRPGLRTPRPACARLGCPAGPVLVLVHLVWFFDLVFDSVFFLSH